MHQFRHWVLKMLGIQRVNKTDKSPYVIALTLVDGQEIREIYSVLGDCYGYEEK